MSSPYDTLPASAFWRSGVAEQSAQRIDGLYAPKFAITPQTQIMTAGSCFAQHVHRNLRDRDWNVIDVETPPGAFPREVLTRYGYGLYSARYGNIYTAHQLRQLLGEAAETFTPAAAIWQKNGRYFDALRPSVEPEGLEDAEHVTLARRHHILKLNRALEQADVFVFTLGLTETWRHTASGTVYPTAPGVIAGTARDDIAFHNFSMPEVLEDLAHIRSALHSYNPKMKLLLTVSPVPLTATATHDHVLSATHHSKAILRAAAGEFAQAHEDVDYFPSFELITGPQSKGAFFDKNLRTVTAEGVSAAMEMFFCAHPAAPTGESVKAPANAADPIDFEDELICEEALIEAARHARSTDTKGGAA